VTAVECEGSPRDLGRDQGRACGAALRERFARLGPAARVRLRLGRLRGEEAALRRELARHFPRQAETLAGLAAAAGVPAAWLVACLDREAEVDPAVEIGLAAGGELAPGGAFVAREVPRDWIVRRSRPEGGFRSVELTRPWLAHALLGVNEAGLAVAVLCRPPRAPEAGVPARRAAAVLPAAPLAQDCLQRFSALEACLEWCTGRPGERPTALLFADASGEVAGVELAPGARRLLRSAEGWLAVGGSADARERLGKSLRDGAATGPPLAWADPAARTLEIGASRLAL
jgi:hypothetical protein